MPTDMKAKRILLGTLLVVGALTVFQSSKPDDNKFAISKNINVFAELLRALDRLYVDSLDVEKMSKTAFAAMLKELDPYTEYYSEVDIQRANVITKGEYAGIGTLLIERNGAIVVRQVYENSPAQRGGLAPADTLIAIDGESVKDWGIQKVTAKLSGKPQQPVELTIRPFGKKESKVVPLTREIIQLPVVPYYGLLSGNVGYIKLASFSSERTASEVKKGIEDLTKKGATSLILDLRGNGGGRMEQAIDICGFFLPQHSKIVTMKGKQPEQTREYFTREAPIAPELPLAVLVDGASASASEIVSGSLQDYDRAVIVGMKSFGKGLVQTVIDMPYRGQMKYTNARYHIPSGRCVQAINYDHSKDKLETSVVPDSLLKPFKTAAGRTVYEGSGIIPDVKSEGKELPAVLVAMAQKDLVFDFINHYKSRHAKIAPLDKFKVDEAIINDFKAFAKSKKFTYQTEAQKALQKLIDQAKKDGSYKKNKLMFDRLSAGLKPDINAELNAAMDFLTKGLAGELILRYYNSASLYEYNSWTDHEILKAKKILADKAQMKELLSPKK